MGRGVASDASGRVSGTVAGGRVTVVSVVRVSSSIVDLLGRFDNTSAVGRSATANN